jgi:hypothetical protein
VPLISLYVDVPRAIAGEVASHPVEAMLAAADVASMSSA